MRNLVVFFLTFFLLTPAWAEDVAQNISIRQGDVIAFQLPVPSGTQSVIGQFQGQSVPFFKIPHTTPAVYTALIGVDLAEKTGVYPLHITLENQKQSVQQDVAIHVVPADFGTQTLTLPKDKVELSPETEVRVEKEAQRFQDVFGKSVSERLWQKPFRVPVEGESAKTFGQKRVINGETKNPHTGEDIAAPLGATVAASNDGKIVLTGDFFFNGLSVVIDHGWGLFTMYFHLSEVKVKEGQSVKQGETIGRVGQSGRATGPHLHWGSRIYKARIDPFALVQAVKEE